MDLRLLGAFAALPPGAIVRPARVMAMLGLGLMALTGFVLFAAEASHVAMNGVFQIKAALIGLGILNVLLLAGPAVAKVGSMEPHAALPMRARMAAAFSAVAACGRLIAYF
jgi:hypothetical protein